MIKAGFRLSVVLLLFVLSAPADAQIQRWGVWNGDPCCGVPQEILNYLDASGQTGRVSD